jgi:hypothetical protein
MVRLAGIDGGRLEELVTDAWRMRGPEAITGAGGADEETS